MEQAPQEPRSPADTPARSPAPSPPDDSPWLTTAEAAAYVRLHENTLRRKRVAGELEGVRCGHNGKRLLFHRGDLDAWLQGGGTHA